VSILPELERDLSEAARRRGDPAGAEVRPSRPRRFGGAAGALGAAIAVIVVVVAVALVGSGNRTAPQRPAPPLGATQVEAVPTLGQLREHFAVLRRPQTRADRSWAGAGRTVSPPFQVLLPSLTRLVGKVAGNRVYLTVERIERVPQENQAAGTYSMNVWVVEPNGEAGGAPYSPNVGSYTIFPAPLRAAIWASMVPDGVARVRWAFGCGRACRRPLNLTVSFPVVNNVVAVSIPGGQACGDACRVTAVTWYARDGRVVARFRDSMMPEPVPFPGIR
jgi:hypothetical protein